MANRTWNPIRTYGMATVVAPFSFTAGGTLAPTVFNAGDVVASAAHVAGTNTITITCKDAFNLMTWCDSVVRDDSDNGAYCTWGTVTNEASSTPIVFNINYFTAAGATLPDPTTVTGVLCAFRNTSAPEGDEK